ncbi:MAG: PAS domain-containing protein [Prevotella sp.]|nr:PAS domain-containing protein [Prevotella sp.]
MAYAIWGLGGVAAILLFALIFIQRRTGKRLKGELAELAKIRQGNVEYEFILKAMKLSTWQMDPRRRMITFNNDFRGGQDDHIIPPDSSIDSLVDYLASSDAQRVRTAMDDLCEGRTSYYHQQYRVKSANVKGLTYWEESYATIADRDVDGNPVKIVGTTMIINDRKEMESALIAARNKAEESDRLKTAFLANMGHEIRTPLNAIVGFADLLPVVENEEDRNQLIREIQNNNQKLLRIIDGLVSMSKIEAEAKNLVKSQTNLVEVLSEIAQTYMQMVDSQTVVLATQFPYTELMMTTDVAKLRELVDHLMQNAVKFTLKGSITLGFELIDGEHVRIWVKDTGKGIAEADKERIFERFVKVDEYIPGTGLGLSVAKSHAASLGGTIGVDSRPGEGSTFWVVLPLT